MKGLLARFWQKILETAFFLLFFLTPFIFTPFNYELFEYNKMVAVYFLTVIITTAWLSQMILQGKILFRRTFWTLPFFLFLLSQTVSTFFSLDPHTSFWGYYSRFNGGLLSICCYFLLFSAFVSLFPREKIFSLFSGMICAGVLISLYGILEHFGKSPSCFFITSQFDTACWVQDVQNRVFATFGQPNWLAAYLAVLIPLSLGLTAKNAFFSFSFFFFFFSSLLFYLCLLFTKSRSGFLGVWGALFAFGFFLSILGKKYREKIFLPFWEKIKKTLAFALISFLVLTFLFGTPFSFLNRLTFEPLFSQSSFFSSRKTEISSLKTQKAKEALPSESGITDSGKIRTIVWKGALDIFRHYPWFGSGLETFAFAYYLFRPIEHNYTSEWDFLYNKAHNEYLNYAANSGILGLGSYLFLIFSFVFWLRKKVDHLAFFSSEFFLPFFSLALLFGWFSLLISHFFGFSVVFTQILFFLLPGMLFCLWEKPPFSKEEEKKVKQGFFFSFLQILFLSFIFFLSLRVLGFFLRYWYADFLFAKGYHFAKEEEYPSAYSYLKEAIFLNPREPLYYDEFAYPAAQLALGTEKEATLSAQFKEEAILASNQSISLSPHNVNYYKTRTKVFFALSFLEEKYLPEAVKSLEMAQELSPTDPKISFHLSLLYDKMSRKKETLEALERAISLKSDYKEAYLALASFYQKEKKKEKAREVLKIILEKIDPNEETARQMLENL